MVHDAWFGTPFANHTMDRCHCGDFKRERGLFMPKGIYAAASAMYTERRSLDAIAQNLANAQSAGYRRAEVLRSSFAQTLATEGRNGDIANDGGAGVHEAGIWRDFSQGESRDTQRQLDVALSGDGFFLVETEKGEQLLTRSGHMNVDDQNRLVGNHGWPMLGQGGAIQLPQDAIGFEIDEAGRIFAQIQGDNGVQNQFLDQLRIVGVENTEGLQPRNGQYFVADDQVLSDNESTRVLQGRLENANVDPVTELVKMITLQRHYDAAQKALTRQSRVGEGYSEIIHRA
jgi:flagellar basal-body rod protein FlgG